MHVRFPLRRVRRPHTLPSASSTLNAPALQKHRKAVPSGTVMTVRINESVAMAVLRAGGDVDRRSLSRDYNSVQLIELHVDIHFNESHTIRCASLSTMRGLPVMRENIELC